MKIIDANAIELEEQDILKKIERCGRVCYKSEGQITEGSAYAFVDKLIKRKHFAMTEHAPIVLRVTERIANSILRLGHGTFLNVTLNGTEERYIISGNVRAWYNLLNGAEFVKAAGAVIKTLSVYLQTSLGIEIFTLLFGKENRHTINTTGNYILSQKDILALPNLTEKEALSHLYLTCLFTCDRGVSHELVRMRTASFAQESTRYCNYSKEKFGNEITVIDPHFTGSANMMWFAACHKAEDKYFKMLDWGLTPQQARTVLPNSLKTEIVMSCNLAEWQHVFDLRYHGTTGAPHPQMLEVMSIWYNIVKAKKGYNRWIK